MINYRQSSSNITIKILLLCILVSCGGKSTRSNMMTDMDGYEKGEQKQSNPSNNFSFSTIESKEHTNLKEKFYINHILSRKGRVLWKGWTNVGKLHEEKKQVYCVVTNDDVLYCFDKELYSEIDNDKDDDKDDEDDEDSDDEGDNLNFIKDSQPILIINLSDFSFLKPISKEENPLFFNAQTFEENESQPFMLSTVNTFVETPDFFNTYVFDNRSDSSNKFDISNNAKSKPSLSKDESPFLLLRNIACATQKYFYI